MAHDQTADFTAYKGSSAHPFMHNDDMGLAGGVGSLIEHDADTGIHADDDVNNDFAVVYIRRRDPDGRIPPVPDGIYGKVTDGWHFVAWLKSTNPW